VVNRRTGSYGEDSSKLRFADNPGITALRLFEAFDPEEGTEFSLELGVARNAIALEYKTALAGGVLAGIGASACCVGPLLLLSVGIGGAWTCFVLGVLPANQKLPGAGRGDL
jgi:hypothetical protein